MRTTQSQRLLVLAAISLFLLLSPACNKSGSSNTETTATPAANSPTSAQPAPAAPATPMSPPDPVTPLPTFSAAKKIGMFAYPKNNQSSDQQLRDEYDCYTLVQQQTGIDPEAPPPTGPSSAQVQTAEQQASANVPQAKGGRARGAAKGAAGGAAIGAITGNAGRGAAVGATVGTVRGGRKQSQANAQSKQVAAKSADSQMQQQYSQAKAAYNKQMDTFRRGFSACMDARGYSVK